ncbi:MAG: radical SAM protein [Candidatus Diapherotrites archaeon]|nr:radical SAM protein [Candidatus Diapherotrites archaeon]
MYAYGPVPSRRLGKSLGVSPIPPKTCSYSCVYCQLGRTNHLQARRESFYPREDIFKDIKTVVGESRPDYITFVGDGEPTLCKDLGWLIHECKENWDIPVAVITNGSLFYMEDVRHDLMEADVVLPTLDAGSEELFRKINRPHPDIAFDKMLQGQIDFRKEYHGKIWMEVMLVAGLNDSDEALAGIKKALDMVRPDRIYINVPIRPPAEPWAKPPEPERIMAAHGLLGKTIDIAGYESGNFVVDEFKDARTAILELTSRHPLREEQARKIEEKFAEKIVDKLVSSSELVRVNYRGKVYLLPSRFRRGGSNENNPTGV